MSSNAALPVIVIGAGGHAKVLLDALNRLGATVLGVVDNDPEKIREGTFQGVPVLGGDDQLLARDPASVTLVNAIGTVRSSGARRTIYERYKAKGFSFRTIVDPSAFVAGDVALEEGVQILARAVLQPGVRIGFNTIVNTSATADHDCNIGAHCHVAPGVVLSGQVSIDEGSHLGTGACVIQGVRIGRNCTVGAGAVLIRDLPDAVTAVGVPARILEK